MNKKLAIITVVFENYQILEDFFKTLENQDSKDFHLFIVDVSFLKKEIKNKKIPFTVIHASNLGYSFSVNTGLKKAIKEGFNYFCIVNSDVYFKKDFVRQVLLFLKNHPNSIVGGKIYYAPGFEYHKNRYQKKDLGKILWYAGGFYDWKNVFVVHRGVDKVDKGEYEKTEKTEFISGCLMAFDKGVIDKVGFWDEGYFLYFEDADFCFRAKKKNIPLYYHPKIIIWHKNAQSTGGSGSKIHQKYQSKGRLRFGLKFASFKVKLHLLKNYFFKNNIKFLKIVFLTVILIFLLINNFFLNENFSLSTRFGDEDAHMIGGYFINKGEKLYRDISTHHQPLVYFISAFWQRIINPPNLFIFIKRHREFIFLYSFFWILVFFKFFGFVTIFFIGIYEIYKYEILGNLLLQENIAVYPLAFIFGYLIKTFFALKKPKISELFFLSFSFFITFFSLTSHWFAVFLLGIYFLVFFKKHGTATIFAFIFFLFVFSSFLFLLINPLDYLKETIIYAKLYFMPEIYKFYGSFFSFIKVFFIPFLSLITWPKNSLEWLISFLFLGYFVFNLYLLKIGRLKEAVFLFLVLALTNTRVNSTKGLLYGAFHLVPWLGSLIAVLSFCFPFIKQNYQKINFFILISLLLWLNILPPSYHQTRKNKADEYFIFYQHSEDAGKEIKKLTKPEDKIISIPNDTLVYFVSQRKKGSRQLEFYSWQYKIPEYYQELKRLIEKKRIKLIYLHPHPNGNYEIDEEIYKMIKRYYQEIKGKDGRLYFIAQE